MQRAVDRHADRSQLRPAGCIGQVVRHNAHEGFAFGLATMCLLVRPVKTAAFEDVVITQVKGQVGDRSIKQCRLVAFDRQDIIRLLIHDRFSNFHLAAHRVDGDQRALDFQHLQQFRDAVISLLFSSNTT